jgi:hypothetical protein
MLTNLLIVTLIANLIMNALANNPHVVATNMKLINLNVILATCVMLLQFFYKTWL